ncbi:RNA polymerase sigma factor [Variovorax beijingensis]|uniref:RNA polymerase sigma factor n=2 Tax=Variovorax beijingensis TaxID=2496117 RepID=A0A3P3ELT7_9BURK|nr:RNA polymerase sigma factor [Variovorax beijingensis]RSZ35660.1 RNA polymerase sigma factor [Variovorax beijingensis]
MSCERHLGRLTSPGSARAPGGLRGGSGNPGTCAPTRYDSDFGIGQCSGTGLVPGRRGCVVRVRRGVCAAGARGAAGVHGTHRFRYSGPAPGRRDRSLQRDDADGCADRWPPRAAPLDCRARLADRGGGNGSNAGGYGPGSAPCQCEFAGDPGLAHIRRCGRAARSASAGAGGVGFQRRGSLASVLRRPGPAGPARFLVWFGRNTAGQLSPGAAAVAGRARHGGALPPAQHDRRREPRCRRAQPGAQPVHRQRAAAVAAAAAGHPAAAGGTGRAGRLRAGRLPRQGLRAMSEGMASTLRARMVARYVELRGKLERIVGSRDDAADAMQETWLRLAAMSDGTTTVNNADAYLLRMAANIATDRYRQDNVLLARGEIDALVHMVDEVGDPERIASGRSDVQALSLVLARMPARRRAILVAARVEGQLNSEIAQHLDVSVSTVEKELRAALEYCKKHLPDVEAAQRGHFAGPRKY